MEHLLDRARRLAYEYRQNVAELVAVLAEVDRLRLYETAGYGSLFLFCTGDLLLGEDDAYRLIRSARAARRHPEVLSYLADGQLTPRAVSILAREAAAPDFSELIDRVKGLPVREVEKAVARRHPEEAPKEQTRILSVGSGMDGAAPPIVFRHSFNADEDLNARLDRAKGLLRHRHPEGKLEDVIREAVTVLLQELDPLERDPAAPRPGARSNPWARRVPPSVRDEVWRRDGGRCAYHGPAGRCEATSWLELDHVVPWALGGRSDDAANLRLLCRAHNQGEARRLLGTP